MVTSRKADESDRQRGLEIARRRRAVGLQQHHFATLLGLSVQQYGKYERGQNRLPSSRYELIMKTIVEHEHPGGLPPAGLSEEIAPYEEPPTSRTLINRIRRDLDQLERLVGQAGEGTRPRK